MPTIVGNIIMPNAKNIQQLTDRLRLFGHVEALAVSGSGWAGHDGPAPRDWGRDGPAPRDWGRDGPAPRGGARRPRSPRLRKALEAFEEDGAAIGIGGENAGVDAVGNKLVDAFPGTDDAGLCFENLASMEAAPDTEAAGGDVADNADGTAVAVEEFGIDRKAHTDGVDGGALRNEKARTRGKSGATEEALRALGEGVGDCGDDAVDEHWGKQ